MIPSVKQWYTISYTLKARSYAKNIIEKVVQKMITDEEYMKFLKAIIACVSHGDYCSAKELSALELEKMQKKMNKK